MLEMKIAEGVYFPEGIGVTGIDTRREDEWPA
jgi:hypothetical protein